MSIKLKERKKEPAPQPLAYRVGLRVNADSPASIMSGAPFTRPSPEPTEMSWCQSLPVRGSIPSHVTQVGGGNLALGKNISAQGGPQPANFL